MHGATIKIYMESQPCVKDIIDFQSQHGTGKWEKFNGNVRGTKGH